MKRIFLLLLVLILISSQGCIKPEPVLKDTGIRIVELRGNPYEIGYQHGKELKEEIQYFSHRIEKLIIYKTILKTAKELAEEFGKTYPEFKELIEEMKGISNGAEVPYENILLFNLMDEIVLNYYWKISIIGCSAFVFRNKDGNLIIGRNLDYGVFVNELPLCPVIFKYYPEKGNPFISISFPGLVGAYTGISKNLYISINVSQSHKTNMGAPECLITRKIIQYSNSIDEALENALYPYQGLNLLIADDKKAVVLEISPRKKAIRELDKERFLVITNHFQHPEMISEQAEKLIEELPTPVDGTFVRQINTKEREKIIREMISSKEEIDVEYGKEILKNVSTRLTLQSIIYLPFQRKLFIAKNTTSPVSYGEWLEFNLKLLL
ncbi:C45 family autoproteolytic acyltransferase/hydolase [Dictyoglomus turgidum]|jgi:predicted choloylglycine hydrolase|uniref:C45 family autoproteolytic acyltransferase/hydolase n=1 Tax=Dictyoglomus turgidum TaxID=513050 RepID=UPI0023563D2B|nr:C45 family peptidase [Dictyoglomus turgidum]